MSDRRGDEKSALDSCFLLGPLSPPSINVMYKCTRTHSDTFPDAFELVRGYSSYMRPNESCNGQLMRCA